ncbi:PaREP1 family protein [Candidatus Bathyarchaeota archaeon]|nr:PaREP1 family protein [Candidatus Bathyarchaeota archaeon]
MGSLERIKLIERLISEANGYLEKDDAVQSSEELYKAAEESIKALAEHFNLEEVKEAEKKGRWTVALLEKSVGKLTDKLGMEVEHGWDAANYLQVWGFHEAKLDSEYVKRRLPLIIRLKELTKKIYSKSNKKS